MGWWAAVRRWFSDAPVYEAALAEALTQPLPPREASIADSPQTGPPKDSANNQVLRALSADPKTSMFNSPIVEELAGRLRILARRSHDEPDRLFFTSLRRSVMNDGIDLRTMPKAIVPLHRMLGQPDVEIRRLATTLQLEPSIATRVVAISNSSLFGGSGRVSSVEDAIVRLGLAETRNIVMAITAHSKLFRMPGHQDNADALYNHALASAVAGKRIAETNRCVPGEEAFIACLLSELGRIVVFTAASEQRRASRGKSVPSEKTVTKTSEDLHGAISALIAESWSFDPDTVAAILNHHRPSSAPPEVRHVSQLMFVADDVARRVISPNQRRELSFSIVGAQKAMGMAGEVDEMVKRCHDDFLELSRLVATPPRGGPPIRGKAM